MFWFVTVTRSLPCEMHWSLSPLLCDRIDFSAVFVVAAHGTALEKVNAYLCYCFKSKRIFHHIMTFSPSMLMNFILPGSSLTIEIKCQLRPLQAERKFISHHEDYKNYKTERAIVNKLTMYPFLFSPLWIYKMTKEDWVTVKLKDKAVLQEKEVFLFFIWTTNNNNKKK